MSAGARMQLDRLLHSQGFGTRRECRGLVRAGRVTVAGTVCDDPFVEVDADGDGGLIFLVDGAPWQYRAQACLVLNKPAGFECSHRPLHHPSVFSLLPAPLVHRGVQAVGRLDEDTTGLLLLTDDGQWLHALSSPRRKVAKVYEATLKHAAGPELVEALLAGVQLHHEPAPSAAAACELLAPERLRLTITEGKYHQVKRMVAAAGNRVEQLRRVAVGGLALPEDLPEGAWRWLAPDEVARVFAGA